MSRHNGVMSSQVVESRTKSCVLLINAQVLGINCQGLCIPVSTEIVYPPGTRVIQLLRDRRDMFRLRYEGKD